MKALIAALLLAASGCAPETNNAFVAGVLEPVSPRVSAEARRLGLEVAAQAPSDAAVLSASIAVKNGEVMADWASLRFRTALAIAAGSRKLLIRLPETPAGRDLLDYGEEWQVLARVSRELGAMRPVLDGGAPAPAPFSVPPGVHLRSWTLHGRRYALLVNASEAPAPLDQNSLVPWRALFEVRSDARQVLSACPGGGCLAPGGVLWLEGRLFPDLLP